MARPEYQGPILPDGNQTTLIGVARALTGKAYPLSGMGLAAATNDLRAQHERVRLRTPYTEVVRLVRTKDPIISDTAQEATQAALQYRHADSVRLANFSYGYAEVDHKDSLGGDAVTLALNAHRVVLAMMLADTRIRPGFIGGEQWRVISEQRQQARDAGDLFGELTLLRMAVHGAAAMGDVGVDVREYCDPMALVTIE